MEKKHFQIDFDRVERLDKALCLVDGELTERLPFGSSSAEWFF